MSEGEAPVVKVRGGRQTRAVPKERMKRSAFLVTVSTNQRYKADDPHKESDSEVFEGVLQKVGENLPKYVRMMDGSKWDRKHVPGKVEFDYTVEWGSKTGALHGHALIKIEHQTRVQLRFEEIKKLFKSELGLPNVYLDVKVVKWPDQESWLLDYINKGQE